MQSKQTRIIAPSVLSSDFANLATDLGQMLELGADWLHVDVMDGHFVPNLTMGPCVVQSIRKQFPNCFIDCHLMVSDPAKWVDSFCGIGIQVFTFHYEALENEQKIIELIQQIKSKYSQTKVGISIKPGTSPDVLSDQILQLVDVVLIMTVEPGFGGQSYMQKCAEKCVVLKQKCNQLKLTNIIFEVDGGINDKTIVHAAECGMDAFVAGSYLFGGDRKERMAALRGAGK